MNNTFYLKYRPQKIGDLDIVSVRNTLSSIFKSGNIPHVFLFTGPRGTGKTSAARIVAKNLCCEHITAKNFIACNKCSQCESISKGVNIDVIEMDAASNRGIEDVRALRDVINLAPARAKSKVYIIDEAHMLTTEASNALLKTLEEPPDHVYFILATTNPEKIIETIKSRAMIINFPKATDKELKSSLKKIILAEKIKISDEELKIILDVSRGSFRDGAKILERVSLEGTGFLKREKGDINEIISALDEKNVKKVIKEINIQVDGGVSCNDLTEEILRILRKRMIEENNKEVVGLIELLITSLEYSKISPIPQLPLELAFFKWFTEK